MCRAWSNLLGPSHVLFHLVFRTTLGGEDSYCSHLADKEKSQRLNRLSPGGVSTHTGVHLVLKRSPWSPRHPASQSAPRWLEMSCQTFLSPGFFLSLLLEGEPRDNPMTPADRHSVKASHSSGVTHGPEKRHFLPAQHFDGTVL